MHASAAHEIRDDRVNLLIADGEVVWADRFQKIAEPRPPRAKPEGQEHKTNVSCYRQE